MGWYPYVSRQRYDTDTCTYMATEHPFAEEINEMFGTNHTIEEYQFVGCIQGMSNAEITKYRLLQWKNTVKGMLPRNLLARQLRACRLHARDLAPFQEKV